MRTAAVREGDEWVLHGQKVWTTFGHHADWIYVLARTDPDASKHRGLSMLLVPMRQPGIEVRRIVNLAGAGEFCEVFFDGARTAAHLVVGEVNGGWGVALGTLGFERGTATLPHQMAFEREVDDLIVARGAVSRTIPSCANGSPMRGSVFASSGSRIARSRASWAATARSGPRRRSARSTGRSGTSSSAS